MDEIFYKLSAEPFRLSPDHRFCYDHKCYAKARAYMSYAYMRAEGFVMITGRPGTGKTTLIGELIESLADENVKTANLVCTQLHADDLLKVTAYEFGVDHQITEKGELLQHIGLLLKTWHREGRRALLIVDEAQDLTESAMEELRLLTNIQENNKPLLQIFLLGQPELRELILRPSMEQVHQRIVASSHLVALEKDETEAYILHRLNKVGWQGDPVLSKTIFPLIHKFSEGVPRRINLICSRLFLHGSVEQRHQIGVADLQEVIQELQSENLAVSTQYSEADFQLEDEFDAPPKTPEITHPAIPDVTQGESGTAGIRPQNSSPSVPIPINRAAAEELHTIDEEVVMQFDSATGQPSLHQEKKKKLVVTPLPRTTPTTKPDVTPLECEHPGNADAAGNQDPPKSHHESPVAPSQQEIDKPADTSAKAPPRQNTEGSTPQSAGKSRPQRKTLPVMLALISMVVLLVVGWFAVRDKPSFQQFWQGLNTEETHPVITQATIERNQQSELREEPAETPATDEEVFTETLAEPAITALPLPENPADPIPDLAPGTEPEVPADSTVPATEAMHFSIVFDFDSASLSQTAQSMLDDVAELFLKTGSGPIQVTGFADELGDPAYNQALSQRRADAVSQYLVAGGVDENMLHVAGLGIYSEAATPNTDTPEARHTNGRIVQLELNLKPTL